MSSVLLPSLILYFVFFEEASTDYRVPIPRTRNTSFHPGFPSCSLIWDFLLASLRQFAVWVSRSRAPALFAWYTVEVIRSLGIGILIYVTIDQPVPLSSTTTIFTLLFSAATQYSPSFYSNRHTTFFSFLRKSYWKRSRFDIVFSFRGRSCKNHQFLDFIR